MKKHFVLTSVADPDPDLDPDPQGSASFGRIRIHIQNFGCRIRLQNWHLINLFSVEKYCE
jgi:hypothetical protein